VVHLIRAAMKFVSDKERKAVVATLKDISRADLGAAEIAEWLNERSRPG